MDPTERLAEAHLKTRGFSTLVYEPDGNVPPDFLADGRVAAEVRRLNQNEQGRAELRGLEEVEIPLLKHLDALLASYGAPSKEAWWVTIDFKRPVPRWSTLEPLVKAFLDQCVARNMQQRERRTIGPNLTLDVFPRRRRSSRTFAVAFTSDDDSGGWVIPELERNLRLCIDEKTRKVAPYRSRYAEWWLLLVDLFAFGLDEFDRQHFRNEVHIAHTWDKVIIVNPVRPSDHFTL